MFRFFAKAKNYLKTGSWSEPQLKKQKPKLPKSYCAKFALIRFNSAFLTNQEYYKEFLAKHRTSNTVDKLQDFSICEVIAYRIDEKMNKFILQHPYKELKGSKNRDWKCFNYANFFRIGRYFFKTLIKEINLAIEQYKRMNHESMNEETMNEKGFNGKRTNGKIMNDQRIRKWMVIEIFQIIQSFYLSRGANGKSEDYAETYFKKYQKLVSILYPLVIHQNYDENDQEQRLFNFFKEPTVTVNDILKQIDQFKSIGNGMMFRRYDRDDGSDESDGSGGDGGDGGDGSGSGGGGGFFF